LKILQSTEYFLPDVERGIERFVYELSRGLMGAGQDVTVLAGGRGRERTLGGVRIEYASMYSKYVARCASTLYGRRISYLPPGIIKMYRQRPDIVHAHHYVSGYAASLLKKHNGTPYVLTVHRAPSPSPLAHIMYKKALEGASAVISVSNTVKESVDKEFGVDSKVIPISVDARKFMPADLAFCSEKPAPEEFGWGAAVSQYISIYESVVKA
jgi:glycosyltransferase involved in cell wall biosynthesis